MARITLKDGRVFDVKSMVTAPRPRVTLIGKSIHRPRPPRALTFS